MHPLLPAPTQSWPLHDAAATRRIEAAAQATLPPHTLMRRAGVSVARLALAVAPHARRVLVLAGPGNNGGDGFEAARELQALGREVRVVHFAAGAAPADALAAQQRAAAAGVPVWQDVGEPDAELLIDALLGVGASRAPDAPMADAIRRTAKVPCVIAVDGPSGLHPDHGTALGPVAVRATHTLALLTAKPGFFTADGRDHAGRVWLDRLGVEITEAPSATLIHPPPLPPRRHAQHKGSFGDVLVVGGAPGMTGALWLAARAALAAGAGRVYVHPLDPQASLFDAMQPELMGRRGGAPAGATVVCGCGGGDAVREALPALLSRAARLLLDADALNAIAADAGLQTLLAARADRALPTVLTPHPLEAARLLGLRTAAEVQVDRLAAADMLAQRWRCIVVLKGSGSVIAAPGRPPAINPTGNARLASPGTGDVLAGWIAGRWAQAGGDGYDSALRGVFEHGLAADEGSSAVLPANRLIDALRR